jgi:hypothetical protein
MPGTCPGTAVVVRASVSADLVAPDAKHTSAFPRRSYARVVHVPSPRKRGRSATPRGERALPQGGSGESRVPVAPAASRVEKNTRVSHHRFTGTPGLPCAMVLTVSSALSLVTGLVCHHRQRSYLRQLDAGVGASGPHGFAVRAQRHSSFDMPRPPHPVPNVRDDRDTPLMRAGMAIDVEVIWVKSEPEYFYEGDSTVIC